MSSRPRRTAVAVTLSVLLFASAIAVPGAAVTSESVGASALADRNPAGDHPPAVNESPQNRNTEDPESDRRPGPQRAPPERNRSTSGGSSIGTAGTDGHGVTTDLVNASGPVEVIVQFEDPDPRTLRRSDDVVETLQERLAASDRALAEFARVHEGVTVERSFWITNAALVTLDADAIDPNDLARIDGVTRIHPNYEGEYEGVASVGDDTGASDAGIDPGNTTTSNGYQVTYGLDMIDAPTFWERYDTRGANATVAVVDSGIEPDHPDLDLAPNGWADFDEHGNRIDSEPHESWFTSHGTHVSGTVAGGNASGTHIGVAPEAELMVAGPGENLTVASAYAAFEWAIAHENDVDVLSASLGFGEGVDVLQEPIRNARLSGIVFVGSAGNEYAGVVTTPGDSYDGVNVGAVNENARVADFSSSATIDADQYWESVPDDWPEQYTVPTVVAPGVQVCSAVAGADYACDYDGTSMAAPHVAGAAALLRSQNPDMSVEDIRLRLSRTATTPANLTAVPQVRYGHGIVNVTRAQGAAFADVGGTVRTDGTPVEGAEVSSDTGTSTRTAADGTYDLAIQEGNRTLRFDAFGYEPVERNLEVSNDTVVDANLTDRRPEIANVTRLPEGGDPGETLTATYRVGGATNVTVEPTARFADHANTSLTIAGDDTATYGEPVAIDAEAGNVTVEIGTYADFAGVLEFDLIASGGGESTTVTSGPTGVYGDLVRYPSDVQDTVDLGTVVDGVGANGTVIVEAGTHVIEPDEDNPENATMVLEAGTGVRAADGATPVLRIEGVLNESVGVYLAGQSATLSGVTVRGNGVDRLVSMTGDDTTLRNTTLRDAGIGVLVPHGDGATIADNDLRNVGTGIDTEWYATVDSIRSNHVANATEYALRTNGDVGTISDNTIVAPEEATAGIDTYANGPVVNNTVRANGNDTDLIVVGDSDQRRVVSGNDLTGGEGGIVLISDGPVTVRNNRIDGSKHGIQELGVSEPTATNHRILRNEINGTDFGVYLLRDVNGTVVAENRIRNADWNSVFLRTVRNVSFVDNEIVDGLFLIRGSTDVTIENTTLRGTQGRIVVGGVQFYGGGGEYHRSSNVSISGTSATDSELPVLVQGGTTSIAVEHSDAMAANYGDGSRAITDFALAGRTTIDVNGTDVHIGLGSVSADIPEHRTQLGPTFEVEERIPNGSIGRFEVAVAESELEDVDEESVALAAYDGGNWTVVANATVSEGSVFVSNVSAFGHVAFLGTPGQSDDGGDGGGSDGGPVFIPAPPSGDEGGASPSFTLTSLELGATEIQVGESVAVNVRVDNDGDADGEYDGTLTVDGQPVDNASVSINANWHETVTLEHTFEEPGTYELAVDGEAAGTVTVVGEPDLRIADATVDETTVEPGETVTVTATVENAGSVEGSTTVPFSVDGDQTGTANVTVPADGTETVTFEHTFETEGSHRISVGGEQVETVTVESSGGDSLPGFGAIAAILGLLGGLALARRRL